MTKELFYGIEDYLGLVNFVTVAGRDGKININSAPVEILMALDQDMSEENARNLVEFREDEENKEMLANTGWY